MNLVTFIQKFLLRIDRSQCSTTVRLYRKPALFCSKTVNKSTILVIYCGVKYILMLYPGSRAIQMFYI